MALNNLQMTPNSGPVDTVGAVARRQLCLTFQPDQTVKIILTAMQSTHCGAAGVIDEKSHLIGVISEREILRRIFSLLDDPTVNPANLAKHVEHLTVRDVMTAQPVVLDDAMDVEEAHEIMTAHGFRYMPVVSRDHPSRMVGIADEREVAFHVKQRLCGIRDSAQAKDTLLSHVLHESYGGVQPSEEFEKL